jgi:hypothetical protein
MTSTSQPSNADILSAVQGIAHEQTRQGAVLNNLHGVVTAHSHILNRISSDQSIARGELTHVGRDVSALYLKTGLIQDDQKGIHGAMIGLRDDLTALRTETHEGFAGVKVDLADHEAHINDR